MPAPVFEFTDRATPIVQFGRTVKETHGVDKWGRGLWGGARWGRKEWEPLWFDTTCEIHEITTQTGRQSATDRFVPGTAHIIASNANQLADALFPEMPADPAQFEPIPQRIVKAPAGRRGTGQGGVQSVDTDGWTFEDDFGGGQDEWLFPPAWAGNIGDVPVDPFKLIDSHFEPEWYQVGSSFEGYGAAQWTGHYDPDLGSQIDVTVDNLSWPATATGTPSTVVELYLRMNTTNRECDCARLTFTPNFAGANTVVIDVFRMGPTGSRVTGVTTPYTVTTGVGSNGDFEDPVTIRFQVFPDPSGDTLQVTSSFGGPFTIWSWTDPVRVPGTRIGVYVGYDQGDLGAVDPPGPPRLITLGGLDFVDPLVRLPDDFWVLHPAWARQGWTGMRALRGAMIPAEQRTTGTGYSASSMTQFDVDFDGDLFVEFTLTSVSMPDPPSGAASTYLEVYLHGNDRNMAAMVLELEYVPDWGASDNEARWFLYQTGPSQERIVYDPAAEGTVNFGATGGVFPEPATWRFESDVDGTQRLFYNRTLLYIAVAPAPATGGRVGIHMAWSAGQPPDGDPRPKVARIEHVTGGEQDPGEVEALGMRVRVGVDHVDFGACWLFNGFVDAIVPTYDPARDDTVRIECIDALGEAGRPPVPEIGRKIAEGTRRIRAVLDAAGWPRKMRDLAEDATPMTRAPAGKALNALVNIAESCGGFIFGDTDTGHVIFRNQDWLGTFTGEMDAYITNHKPDSNDPVVRVCPSGWELSSERRDLTTRITLSTAGNDELEPITKGWRNPDAERLFGIESPMERTYLCTNKEQLREIASRTLRLRSPQHFPRVRAVLFDAAVDAETLDLVARATITKPSRYHCQLRRGGEWVFNRNFMATGIRHVISPTRWTCRLALDITSVFDSYGARWGVSRWSADDATWGRTR